MFDLFNQKEGYKIEMGPSFVFRFRPPTAFTLSELEDSYIWFSDRNSLNDELDSSPEFVSLSNNPEEQRLFFEIL